MGAGKEGEALCPEGVVHTFRLLDSKEVPVLGRALSKQAAGGAAVTPNAHKEASVEGAVFRKVTRNPYLLQELQKVLGPDVSLVGTCRFRSDDAAATLLAENELSNLVAVCVSPDVTSSVDKAAEIPAGRGMLWRPGAKAVQAPIKSGFAAFYAPTSACKALAEAESVLKDQGAGEDSPTKKGVAKYVRMDQCTEEDMVVQCAVFDAEKRNNQARRVLDMVRALKGVDVGVMVDLYEHSLQTATRCYRAGGDEETVVCALLHDIGELISPNCHGELPASILRPYISPKNWWILAHHEVFQAYYYLHKCGGDPNVRDKYKDHEFFGACESFCFNFDQMSFDPDYDTLPLEFFEPMVGRILSREPYWHLDQVNNMTCMTKDMISSGYC